MKIKSAIPSVVLATSALLLFGCEGPLEEPEREANVKCGKVDRHPPPEGKSELPIRFEAENLPEHASARAHERTDRDWEASNHHVSEVDFRRHDGAIVYSFKSHDDTAAEVWLRVRQGRDQAIFDAWLDDTKDAKVTIDGYAQKKAFVEVKIGAIAAKPSRHRTTHVVRLQVTGRNPASWSRGITLDYIELRAPAPTPDPDPGPCASQPDGTACDDGAACTQNDQCQAGTCVGAPVVCAALDGCHAAGVCDPATGACSNPEQPDGTLCNDQDLCTQEDTCVAGACVGASPVVCAALDGCHAAGVCDPATGTCSNPEQPDGTLCDDQNLCTQEDTCVAGACVGANPVVCPASPFCAVQGACEPTTGTCSAATECSACGNGQLEQGEECDPGDSIPDDGCSATCKYELCGDGLVQPTLQDVTFYFLGRACGVSASPLSIRINGVEVLHQNLPETCDCLPGIQSVRVTDPTLRAAAVNGGNLIELSTGGELAWVLGVFYTRTMAVAMPLWDWNGNNDVGNMNPDLCASGALANFGVSTGVGLSGGETCDDGNYVDGDGCSTVCLLE